MLHKNIGLYAYYIVRHIHICWQYSKERKMNVYSKRLVTRCICEREQTTTTAATAAATKRQATDDGDDDENDGKKRVSDAKFTVWLEKKELYWNRWKWLWTQEKKLIFWYTKRCCFYFFSFLCIEPTKCWFGPLENCTIILACDFPSNHIFFLFWVTNTNSAGYALFFLIVCIDNSEIWNGE